MESHTPSTHNLGGLPLEERAKLEISAALEGPLERWKQLQEGANRAPAVIENETQAEAFTTILAQLQALRQRIDRVHTDVKEPYLTAGRAVDAARMNLHEDVADLFNVLQKRLTTYQVEKQRKVEEERKAIVQREASDPEPSWTPPQTTKSRTRVRSIEGASAHLVEVTDIEITDIRAIPDRYLKRDKVMKALRSELLADVRKGDEIPGVKKTSAYESRVKG